MNAPVHVFSINQCKNLTVKGVTIDNKAGDMEWNAGKGGRNTDAFDIGASSEVVIEGARVWNQDDCVAVNSGTVSSPGFILLSLREESLVKLSS